MICQREAYEYRAISCFCNPSADSEKKTRPSANNRQTDRQTDILLTEKKSHYRLICHRNERDICTCIYKIVSLLKSYDNIHGMTYTAKIMLSGIAKIKTGYFDNINDYY